MEVGVLKARDHKASLKIDYRGIARGQCFDLLIIADCDDFVSTDR
jgi:hypothetical protein